MFKLHRRSLLGAACLSAVSALSACEETAAPQQPAADAVAEPVAVAKKSAPAPATHERITVGDDGTVTPMAATACAPNSADDAVRRALASGRADEVTEKSVIDFTARLANCRWERAQIIQQAITEDLPPITWNASHDQPRLSLAAGDTMPLLLSNGSGKNSTRTGGIMGAASLLHPRSIALTANPMRTGMGPGMEEFLTRTLTFLSDGKADPESAAPFTVAISQMSDSYYFRDRTRTREWLDATYGERARYNDPQACDGDALAGCLETADVLLLGSVGEPDVPTIRAAMESGPGVLFMHIDDKIAPTDLLPLFGLQHRGDNYWTHPTLDAAPAVTGRGAALAEADGLLDVMHGIYRDDLPVTFAGCENHNCPDDSPYATMVKPVLDGLNGRLRALDGAGLPIFDQPGMSFDKAAVLMGDIHRGAASFPLDKSGDRRANLRTRFADMSVAHLRTSAPAWSELGNHASAEPTVPTSTREVSLEARRYYRSAGVYALPGQTIRVTRTDDMSETTTKVRVNLVRWASTHPFNDNGYTRPAQVSSPDMPIAPGETITLTSPAGGPVLIRFDGETGAQTAFTFENVASHPVWRGPEDDAEFIAAVDSGDWDWAEIITPGFEVHSTNTKMQDTLARGLSPAAVAELTSRNFTDYAHALAGFTGRGITEIEEVHGWARGQGIPLSEIDVVKHMNADQATCGYGCSGNPYDAYWAFDPLGHGDLHELGHGLERGRMNFEGQAGHALTNPYSYYAKSRFQLEESDTTSCQSLPFRTLFEQVQAAALEPNFYDAMRKNDRTGWSWGAAVRTQTMIGAQNAGLLERGEHFLARLHIIERAFNTARGSDQLWDEQAAALGFAGFTRTQARELSNNDFILIAASHALGRDMTEWYSRWGHETSDVARAHVAPLPDFPVRFYLAAPTAACDGFPTEWLPIDGTSKWPEDPGQERSAEWFEPKASESCDLH